MPLPHALWSLMCRAGILVAVTGSLLAAPLPASAGFEAGLEAYDSGDYPRAAQEWAGAAEAGDQAAMRNLGHLYRWGRGVPADAVKAEYWYRRAAGLGFDRAMVNLGMLYLDGAPGVPRDPVEGRHWLQKAAALGNPDAADALADLENGRIPLLNRVAQPKSPAQAADAAMTATATTTKTDTPGTSPASPPAAPETPNRGLAPSAGSATVLAHLGLFTTEAEARAHWDALAAKVPALEPLAPYFLHGFVPGKGPVVRLYARGADSALQALCHAVPEGTDCELHQAFQ